MKKISLTAQIGIALVLAVIAGILLGNHADFVNTYIKPFGIIFLNLLKFIVVPLVLFSIMAGILSMNDISKVGKLGLRALLYFMATTLFAVTLGLVVPSLLKGILPTIHISTAATAETIETQHLSVRHGFKKRLCAACHRQELSHIWYSSCCISLAWLPSWP